MGGSATTGGASGVMAGGSVQASGGTLPSIMTSVPAACQLPVDIGSACNVPGGTRYFFDASANVCKPFTYGGCGGNDNDFSSLQGCQNFCQLRIECSCMSAAASSMCSVTRECLACPSSIVVKDTNGTSCSPAGLKCRVGAPSCTCVTPPEAGIGVWRCGTTVGP
ncbi:MAG TPA: BPTI/Kunitz domain-containing protein [Polyangiaceae bacterium]|nr:BPTI/Kunitz domain-containing protein [Polyangiaceae bacterium]